MIKWEKVKTNKVTGTNPFPSNTTWRRKPGMTDPQPAMFEGIREDFKGFVGNFSGGSNTSNSMNEMKMLAKYTDRKFYYGMDIQRFIENDLKTGVPVTNEDNRDGGGQSAVFLLEVNFGGMDDRFHKPIDKARQKLP